MDESCSDRADRADGFSFPIHLKAPLTNYRVVNSGTTQSSNFIFHLYLWHLSGSLRGNSPARLQSCRELTGSNLFSGNLESFSKYS